MQILADEQGRQFSYLRLSVTDVCNFRCNYCLPGGYQSHGAQAAPLRVSEIRHLAAGFAALGFWKVRLTGGEPTTRGDIVELARTVASVPGIRTLALTTNGWRLAQLAATLREAGVTSLNVSVDSLSPECFARTTGHARLPEVLAGIEAALNAGFPGVKVNTVLMKGVNDGELDAFLEWTRRTPITVRFIELMRTADNQALFDRCHLSSSQLKRRLQEAGWTPAPRTDGAGPAVELTHPGHIGRVGLIAPYSSDFCRTCNRLRVSSLGALRLCLFGEADYSLRHLLHSADQHQELVATLCRVVSRKPKAHHLHEGRYGSTANLAAIGG